MAIRIVDYEPALQPGIDRMMEGIQKEFQVPITGPSSAHLDQFYKQPGYRFWAAKHGDHIAGTIGVKLFGGNKAEIKRMMVDKQYRGSTHNTARLLMEVALQHARNEGCSTVYLGTMEQFQAAQKFYANYGFTPVMDQDLPQDYVINPIDKLFYKLSLSATK